MSKVILLNGSAHQNGCTRTALDEMIKVFEAEGIETELIQVGVKAVRGCISCNTCYETGKCVFDDLVNEVAPKFETADGLVVGSPVYYASPNGTILSFMDRLEFFFLPGHAVVYLHSVFLRWSLLKPFVFGCKNYAAFLFRFRITFPSAWRVNA